jgi:hypothetical protein
MPLPETNDPLDTLLHENEPYIDDNGFSARVVASLPPRRRSWLRPVVLFSATLLGLALLVWWLPSLKDELGAGVSGEIVINLNAQSLMTLGVLLVSVAAIGWGLFAAVRSED